MNITNRRYKILADFERVYQFLTDTYDKETTVIGFENICNRELWRKEW